ncbi:c-type cytochrome [Halovulum sp. GXIMD14794]
MKRTALLGIAMVAIAGAASAEQLGEREYMNSCVACHGAGGKGGGEISELLTVDIPDLTTIAARNDGEFPMLEVIQIIDGRTGVRGHGGPMPLWGDRYAVEIGESAGPYGAELAIRGRVLSLAYYLESIQE